PTATKVRPMNSRPYLIARSLSEYGFTGSMKATLKDSTQPASALLPGGIARAYAGCGPSSSDSPAPSGTHSEARRAKSLGAVVASDETCQVALNPWARTSRVIGRKRPPKEGG